MAIITRYVLVSPDNIESDYQYENYDDAVDAASHIRYAVVEHTYEWTDSDLAWTPNGSKTWPPEKT